MDKVAMHGLVAAMYYTFREPETIKANVCDRLVQDMLDTGKFRKERLMQPGLLPNLHLAGCSVILPEPGIASRTDIYAHVARLGTKDPGWDEIILAYVNPNYTRSGYLEQITKKLFEEAPPDLKFFGITRDIATMKVFKKRGLVPVTKAVEPHINAWRSALGITRTILPKTALLETEPDLDRIYADAMNPKKAQRWLWKQM
jgi:hypothetical protein